MVCSDTKLEYGALGSTVATSLVTGRDNVDAIVGARRLPWLIKGKETKYVEHKRRMNALSPPSYRGKRRKTTVPISGTVPTVNAAPMVMNTKALLELTTLCQKMRERETAASRQQLYNDTIDYLITLAVTDPNSTRLLRRLGTLLGYAYTGIHDIKDIDDLGKKIFGISKLCTSSLMLLQNILMAH